MVGADLEVKCLKCSKTIYLSKGTEFKRPCHCGKKVKVTEQGRNVKLSPFPTTFNCQYCKGRGFVLWNDKALSCDHTGKFMLICCDCGEGSHEIWVSPEYNINNITSSRCTRCFNYYCKNYPKTYKKGSLMTKEEFEEWYCYRSGITLVEYHGELNQITLPCECGDSSCDGWAAVTNHPLSVKVHLELNTAEGRKRLKERHTTN